MFRAEQSDNRRRGYSPGGTKNKNKMDFQKKLTDYAKEYCQLRLKYNNAKEAAAKAKTEIETALFNLRTYKNVLELYPEAYGFLPAPAKAGKKQTEL